MTNPYATIRAALESIRVCDDMTGEREAALAALAELEKASKESVGEVESSPFGLIPAVDTNKLKRGMKLYTTPPPAPVVEIRDAVITDEVARKVFNAWIDARWRLNEGQDAKYGHAMINVVRAELGPALGLVEIREPTPEECERICTEYERLLMREGTCGGRDAFDAVRAVMWPKSEGS